MIETECFDDLNSFYNPDGTLVANLNETMPPIDDGMGDRKGLFPCCPLLFTSSSSSSSHSSARHGGHSRRAPKHYRGGKRHQNHNNNTSNATEISLTDSTAAGCPVDPLEGISPSLDDIFRLSEDSGEELLDAAVLRSHASAEKKAQLQQRQTPSSISPCSDTPPPSLNNTAADTNSNPRTPPG